jgi:hypothetical protein
LISESAKSAQSTEQSNRRTCDSTAKLPEINPQIVMLKVGIRNPRVPHPSSAWVGANHLHIPRVVILSEAKDPGDLQAKNALESFSRNLQPFVIPAGGTTCRTKPNQTPPGVQSAPFSRK